MTITTAFYIYGTLIDPHGVTIANGTKGTTGARQGS